jgi:hypothetical protein
MRAFIFSVRFAIAVPVIAVMAAPALADCATTFQSCQYRSHDVFANCAGRCWWFDDGCKAACQQGWKINYQNCVVTGNRCIAIQDRTGYPPTDPPPSPVDVPKPGPIYLPQSPGPYVPQPQFYPPVPGGYIVQPQQGYAPTPGAGVTPGGYAVTPPTSYGGYAPAPQPFRQPSVACPNAATISMYRMRSPKPGFGC